MLQNVQYLWQHFNLWMTFILIKRKIFLAFEMDYFFQERELWELLDFKSKSFDITDNINSNEVIVSIFHTRNWNINRGKLILTVIWQHFKLSTLGWSESCSVCSYKDYFSNVFDMTPEYAFWLEEFQHRKIFDYDFLYQYKTWYLQKKIFRFNL